MMLLKLGLVLLTGICSSEVANLGCNMYWHFCFRSSPARSVPAPALTALTAAGAGSSYSQSSGGVNETWHLPCSHTSSQRFQGQSPGPEGSLLIAHRDEKWKRLCQNWLLPVVSCCQMLPAPRPPPRRCLFTTDQAAVSQWDPCVLDERPGEFNHSWFGVFYQAYYYSLQLSGFPRRDAGGWFPHRVSSGSCKSFLPHFLFPAPFPLSHCVCPCASQGVGYTK